MIVKILTYNPDKHEFIIDSPTEVKLLDPYAGLAVDDCITYELENKSVEILDNCLVCGPDIFGNECYCPNEGEFKVL